jgi:hypothetical protein
MTLPNVVIPNPGQLPPGLKEGVIEQVVDLSTAAASFSLTKTLPAGSAVTSVAVVIPSTISATTAVKIGVGRVTSSADPDKYWLSAALTAQAAQIPLWQTATGVTADETIGIFACDTNGAAAGTIGGTGQYVHVRLTYINVLPI